VDAKEEVKAALDRLERECAKLDPAFEQRLAEQGLAEDLEVWPGMER